MSNHVGAAPMVFWGNVEDPDVLWSKQGTPVVTPGATDPLGGTDAYTVEDDDGAGFEWIYRTASPRLPDGVAHVGVILKAGTAAATSVVFRDDTLASSSARGLITWGSPPTVAWDIAALETPPLVSLGGGWYALLFSHDKALSANSQSLRLIPAGHNNAANTGTVLFYPRQFLLFSHFDNAVAWPELRDGNDPYQQEDGTEGLFQAGEDYVLTGLLRHIPMEVNHQVAASPWEGQGNRVVFNWSVYDWLEYARNKGAFDWVPDRSDCTQYHTAYLAEPMQGRPGLEENGMRQQPITLRTVDGSKWRGY